MTGQCRPVAPQPAVGRRVGHGGSWGARGHRDALTQDVPFRECDRHPMLLTAIGHINALEPFTVSTTAPTASAASWLASRRSGSCAINERFDGYIVKKFNGGKVKIARGELELL